MKKSAAQLAGCTSNDVFARDVADVEKQLGHLCGKMYVNLVPSRLQETVTCGLVCLLCCADYLRPEHGKTSEELIAFAVERGYTREGEMFSCSNMEALAVDFFKLTARVEQWDGHVEPLLRHLAEGALVMVPYDCSRNFEPGLFNGDKSHWGVVCGALFVDSDGAELLQVTSPAASPSLPVASAAQCSHLVCLQPKSKRVAAWSPSSVAASNAQLANALQGQVVVLQ